MAPLSAVAANIVPIPTAEFVQASDLKSKDTALEGQLNEASLTGHNHYKGHEVYANFGYVCIDGKWVDPESEGELYDAYMGYFDGSSQDLDVAELHRSRDSGPLIMTQAEQDIFYREYVEDVTDEADGDGDPRDYYISPETFARWAEGAVKVDGYVETVIDPTVQNLLSFIMHIIPAICHANENFPSSLSEADTSCRLKFPAISPREKIK